MGLGFENQMSPIDFSQSNKGSGFGELLGITDFVKKKLRTLPLRHRHRTSGKATVNTKPAAPTPRSFFNHFRSISHKHEEIIANRHNKHIHRITNFTKD